MRIRVEVHAQGDSRPHMPGIAHVLIDRDDGRGFALYEKVRTGEPFEVEILPVEFVTRHPDV